MTVATEPQERRALGVLAGSDRRIWLSVFVVVLGMITCWALAAPYFSGPDEAAHDARVWSISRGRLLGSEFVDQAGQGGSRMVEVPQWLSLPQADPACFKADAAAPASCASLVADSTTTETPTSAGAQLPFTYLPASLGFVIASHGPGLLLVRVLGAVVTAALVASSVVTASRSRARRWLVPSIALACPPMFLYIAAVTNPSGPEIAAAIAVWISLIALAVDPEAEPRVLARLAAGSVVLVLSRQLGPLWLATIVVVMLPYLGRARARDLLGDRRVRVVIGVVTIAGVVWALWSVLVRPLTTVETGFGSADRGIDIVRTQVGRLWIRAQESVGVFGWLETRAPMFTYVVWIVGVLLLVALCWISARRWQAVAPVVVMGVGLVAQSVGEYRSVPIMGYFWQGRYTLPLLVGVPLLAGAGLGIVERVPRPSPSSVRAAALLVGAASFVAYAQFLRRYSVGAMGPLDFFLDPTWAPPIPIPVLLVMFAALTATWLVMLGTLATAEPGDLTTTESHCEQPGRPTDLDRAQGAAQRPPRSTQS